ncbi:Uncharacterised protein [Klebsiella pneumoniae subsp. ozaenae]|uniref:Uncharacterized protein n=1 Tax=Klebsiella pneumoniae subsp. ozaenae TaxID=574 RepID=A0A378B4X2_KLEPO|nr:Uncharacterised protein [Klebsiella pneumoniae subsp. ozaenae]
MAPIATAWMRKLPWSSPREDEEVIGDYLISGLRHVIAITSGWKTREGDNGMQ